MVMLGVDVDQHRGDFAQVGQRRRASVDESPRAAIHAKRAPKHATPRIVLVEQRPLREPTLHGGIGVELRTDLRPGGPGTDPRTAPTFTEGQPERIDDDRLAGPRFAGDRGESGFELDLELLDQRVVANAEMPQHRMVEPGEPACG